MFQTRLSLNYSRKSPFSLHPFSCYPQKTKPLFSLWSSPMKPLEAFIILNKHGSLYIYTHGLDPYTSVFPYKSMQARVYVSDPFIIKQTDKVGLYDCHQRRPTAAVCTRLGFWQNFPRSVEYIAGSKSTRSFNGSLFNPYAGIFPYKSMRRRV